MGRRGSSGGFTLLEFVTALAAAGVVVLGAGHLLIGAFDAYRLATEARELEQRIRTTEAVLEHAAMGPEPISLTWRRDPTHQGRPTLYADGQPAVPGVHELRAATPARGAERGDATPVRVLWQARVGGTERRVARTFPVAPERLPRFLPDVRR